MTPLLLILSLASTPLSTSGTPDPDTLVERQTFLMGTRLRGIVQTSQTSHAFDALEAAFSEVARLDRLLSSWRDDSELTRLNRAPPLVPLPLKPPLAQLLQEAWSWSQRTGGAFDPAIGALVDAWDLRGAGRVPGDADLAAALLASGTALFAFDSRQGTGARRCRHAWITAGAFGKGAALRAARIALSERGVSSALLDFGGQLVALGAGPGARGWEIGVAHPRSRHRQVARLLVEDRSVATSAASERYVEVTGERIGHILDPRTGRPVEAWGSVTVVASDPMVADIVSTALFVMGPEAGMEWATGRDDVGALFLEVGGEGLRARWTPAMEPWLIELCPGLTTPARSSSRNLASTTSSSPQAVGCGGVPSTTRSNPEEDT